MGQIIKGGAGAYRCTGHDCGFPLAWFPPCPEEDEPGLWVCLDCNSSMYGDRRPAAQTDGAEA